LGFANNLKCQFFRRSPCTYRLYCMAASYLILMLCYSSVSLASSAQMVESCDAVSETKSSQIPSGSPGGVCLPDNTCYGTARCFKLVDGSNVCLLPSPDKDAEICPSHQRFLICPDDGGICYLRCLQIQGCGCHVMPSAFFSLLPISVLILLWLNGQIIRGRVRPKTR
jgi:hypothetical protein